MEHVLIVDDYEERLNMFKDLLNTYNVFNIKIVKTFNEAMDLMGVSFSHVYSDYYLDNNNRGDAFLKTYKKNHPRTILQLYTGKPLEMVDDIDGLEVCPADKMCQIIKNNHCKNEPPLMIESNLPLVVKRIDEIDCIISEVKECTKSNRKDIDKLIDLVDNDHKCISELISFNESIKPIAKMNVKLAYAVICTILIVAITLLGGSWKFFQFYDGKQEKRFELLEKALSK